MEIKEIHIKLDKQCPSDYKINEIILFSYPYRRLTVNTTVNKSPEQSIQQVYSVLLRTIEIGYNTEKELIQFLGLHEEDFILRELYFLRERGYVDFVSGQWLVTDEGRKFIEDNSILKMLEEEDFEFLIDTITNEVIAKSFRTYKVNENTNKLNPEITYPNRSPELLNNKFEQLADIYKKQNNGKAYLVDYDKNNIKFDSINKEYRDYYLIEYIPSKENDNPPFIEVRNTDEDFSKDERLTKLLSHKYPSILYQFTNSDRATIATLIAEQEENVIEKFKENQIEESNLPDTKTLSIWETQSQFKQALNSVRNNILIESPWIKRATLQYLDLLENALKRNVKIFILYGIKNNDEHDYGTMKKLEELFSKYKSLHLIHLPSHFEKVGNYKMVGTHRKLIIKDNDYYIQGSFNFLSFNKKEGQKVANEESILISKNVQKKWTDVLNEYEINISVKNNNKKQQSVSKNLNIRDISETETKQQSEKTIFSSNTKNNKIAVLEFSTKAVKFLVGPEKSVFEEKGFNFKDFYRHSDFTNTGKCLDNDNLLQIGCFKRNVLNRVRKILQDAKSKNIRTIYSIATAAFRTAENRNEILALIFKATGLNVRILSKEDEAFATLIAFSFTKPQKIRLTEYNIIIDQGGGSTELTLFKEQDLLFSYSFSLGTTMLENIIFENLDLSIQKAFDIAQKLAISIVKAELDVSKFKNISNISCISVGTAITRATGKQNSKQQHGIELSIEDLEKRLNDFQRTIQSRFTNLTDLRNDVSNVKKNNNDSRKVLTSALGLPLFIEILKTLNIDKLVVSGTALWYGIFFQKLYDI